MVRAVRQARGITQKQVQAATGLSHTSLSAIETGAADQRLSTLLKVAAYLDIDLAVLMQNRSDSQE